MRLSRRATTRVGCDVMHICNQAVVVYWWLLFKMHSLFSVVIIQHRLPV